MNGLQEFSCRLNFVNSFVSFCLCHKLSQRVGIFAPNIKKETNYEFRHHTFD